MRDHGPPCVHARGAARLRSTDASASGSPDRARAARTRPVATLSPAPSYRVRSETGADRVRSVNSAGVSVVAARRGREDVLRRHRCQRAASASEDRPDVYEAKAERRRRDEERRRRRDPIVAECPTDDRPTPARRACVVDRDGDLSCGLAAEARVAEKIEQRALPVVGPASRLVAAVGLRRRAREATRAGPPSSRRTRAGRRPRRARPWRRRSGRTATARVAPPPSTSPAAARPAGKQPPPAYLPFAREESEALVKQDTAKVNWDRPMSHAPGLKAALKRGALIAAANWPLVVVQFIAESTLKLLLAVPVLGGIFLVVLLLDADVEELISGSPSEIVRPVFNAMRASPAALVAFVAAFLLVLLGGSALTFVVKAGPCRVLAAAEPRPGRSSGRRCSLQRAAARERHRHRAVPRRLPAILGALRQARRVPAARLRRHRRRLPRPCPRRLRARGNSGILLGWTIATAIGVERR